MSKVKDSLQILYFFLSLYLHLFYADLMWVLDDIIVSKRKQSGQTYRQDTKK